MKKKATVSKKPIPSERASMDEKPTDTERAIQREKPREIERSFTGPERESLSVLVRAYHDYQRERISLDGQIGRTKAGNVKKGVPPRDPGFLTLLMQRREDCYAMELSLEKQVAVLVKTKPLWKYFLKDVKGCGEMMTAVILTQFDIVKWENVSKGWAFAGLAPGKDRKEKGKKCPYNQFLRAKLCGVLGSSFLISNSPYREYYDNMKHRLESNDWGTASKNPTDKKRPKAGHQHKAAIRYMIKMFLKDVYVAWRTLEGLPMREPYSEEYVGKRHSARKKCRGTGETQRVRASHQCRETHEYRASH